MESFTKTLLSLVLIITSLLGNCVLAQGYWVDEYWDENGYHEGYWVEESNPNYSWEQEVINNGGWWDDAAQVWHDVSELYNTSWTPKPTYTYIEPAYGLSIPGLGYSVSLGTSMDLAEAQAYTDAPGIAYRNWDNGYEFIQDHNYQGLGGLVNLPIGSVAYLDGREIHLVSRYYGHNNEYTFWVNDGRMYYEIYDGSVIMYTCTNAPRNIVITYWN